MDGSVGAVDVPRPPIRAARSNQHDHISKVVSEIRPACHLTPRGSVFRVPCLVLRVLLFGVSNFGFLTFEFSGFRFPVSGFRVRSTRPAGFRARSMPCRCHLKAGVACSVFCVPCVVLGVLVFGVLGF